MHLTQLRLRNWRSYRSATFNFAKPEGERNVILVGAMNGTGKTSILMALYLGLFGKEAMHFIEGIRLAQEEEGFRSYRDLLEKILHRPAVNEDEPYAEVGFTFDVDGEELVVSRSWYFTRGGRLRSNGDDNEEVRIEFGREAPERFNAMDATERIEELLFPWYISPCFFFDGEQAQARVEGAGGRAMYDAVSTLFGTKLLQKLSESLRTYVTNTRSQLRRDIGDVRETQLDVRRREKDMHKAALEDCRNRFEEVSAKLAVAEAKRTELLQKLQQLVGDTSYDIEHWAQQLHDAESLENKRRSELCDSLSALALPLAVSKLGPIVQGQLEAELIRDRWLLLRDEAMAKAEAIIQSALPPGQLDAVLPPLTEAQYDQLVQRLKSSLQMLWSPPPENCAPQFKYTFLGQSERDLALAGIRHILEVEVQDVATSALRWREAHLRVSEARKKWDSVRGVQPQYKDLHEKLSQYDEQVKELGPERASLEKELQGYHEKINELRATIAQMESKVEKRGPVEQKLDVAQRVREVIEAVQDDLVPLCKKALEENCSQHFRGMISGEYKGYEVQFDPENQPLLIRDGSPSIFVTTLSGAQKRVFGLAFSLALASVSRRQAPLIIDTPVGNLDSKYRLRVLEHIATNAPGQVIFLSHDEEISGEYATALEPFTLQRYLVDFTAVDDGAGISTPILGRYFD